MVEILLIFLFVVAILVIICCYFCYYFNHLFLFLLLLFLTLLLLLLLVLLSLLLFIFVFIFFHQVISVYIIISFFINAIIIVTFFIFYLNLHCLRCHSFILISIFVTIYRQGCFSYQKYGYYHYYHHRQYLKLRHLYCYYYNIILITVFVVAPNKVVAFVIITMIHTSLCIHLICSLQVFSYSPTVYFR